MARKVVIERQRLLLDDFFKVEEAHLSCERYDGTMSPVVRRLNLERGDSVGVVMVDPVRRTVILIEQFRYAAYTKGHGWLIETVAGMIDAGETPEEAARREVLEETGYKIEALRLISSFFVSPGGSSEWVALYYAEIAHEGRIAPGGGLATEHEDIEVLELPFEECFRRLDAGEIVDAKTIIGLQWLRAKTMQAA
jgi:nudix-type nucleoside diphosphatase (YffH/AdpP family)